MKLSIIIPTLNEEKYIGDTIAQFKTLSVEHEIIVSDAKSPDRTVEVARSLADKVVIYDGAHRNPGIQRNDGVKVASGEFLLFVDADTRLEDPDRFVKLAMERFEKDPTLSGVSCQQHVIPTVAHFVDMLVFGFDNNVQWFFNNVLKIGWACGKCMVVRKSAFDEVGGFRAWLVFGEDHYLFVDLAQKGKTRYIPALKYQHNARRLRKLGLVKFWWTWSSNEAYIILYGKALAKEWTPVR